MSPTDGTAGRASEIRIAEPPRLAGFRLRRFRGPEDHPGMVRANMAARLSQGIVEPVTVDGMANMYANLPNCDVDRDVIIGEVDGEIVAYGRVEWGDNTDGARDYTTICVVDPAVCGHGIGRAMLQWLEGRASEIAGGQSTDRPRFYASSAWDRDEGGHALLLEEGYKAIRRSAEMLRPDLDDLPEVVPPDGLVVRAGSALESRVVWEATVEVFRDHWGTIEDSPAGYAEFLGAPGFDPSLWVVAWDGDEVAGVILASLHEEPTAGGALGYLDSLGVGRPWRRRGVGRALMVEALRVLRTRGATRAGLGVDLENQHDAARFYESLGFRILTTSTEYRKPMVIPESDSQARG